MLFGDAVSFRGRHGSLFSQDVLEYKKKQRPQKIKMLDGAIKTILVDDSKTVGELLVTICSRIGEFRLSPGPPGSPPAPPVKSQVFV